MSGIFWIEEVEAIDAACRATGGHGFNAALICTRCGETAERVTITRRVVEREKGWRVGAPPGEAGTG